MPSRTPRTLLAYLKAGVLALGTAACLYLGLQQQVDPQNRNLKIPDSPIAEANRDLAELLPSLDTVLLAFAAPQALGISEAETQSLETLAEQLRQLPDTAACRALPSPEPDLALYAIDLRNDTRRGAQAATALARSQTPPGLTLRATGLPLLEGRIAELVAAERHSLVPLLVAVLFAAALAVYRRMRLAVAALAPALLAIVWTSGLCAALGHRLDPVQSLLEPVLLTIGVAAAVHLVEGFRRHAGQGQPAERAAALAAAELQRPALWATATTMVGLLALATNPVPAVVDFGVRAAFGVALVHAFVFSLVPRWLAGATAGGDDATASLTVAAAPAAQLPGWFAAVHQRRGSVFAAVGAITALACAGLAQLHTDNDPLALLPADEPCRIDHEALVARLGGVEPLQLLVTERSPAADPLRLLPFVASALQLPGLAGPGGPALRGAGGDLAVPLLLRPGGSELRAPLFHELERTATVLGLDGLRLAGPAVQMVRDSEALLHGLFGSLYLTLVALAAMLVFALRSLRLGLFGMLPNLLPCLWLYGGLGLAGHPVSVATGMIGCTMLGLIVDNTLHLLHRYRELRANRARPDAAVAALAALGRPMLLSSGLLVLGFGTALLSRLSTTREFAVLACCTIAAAGVGCVVLLPLWLCGAALPQRTAAASGETGGNHAN